MGNFKVFEQQFKALMMGYQEDMAAVKKRHKLFMVNWRRYLNVCQPCAHKNEIRAETIAINEAPSTSIPKGNETARMAYSMYLKFKARFSAVQ